MTAGAENRTIRFGGEATDPTPYTWHSVGEGSISFKKGKP